MIGNPHVKRWAYAISKMFEEQLLLACHERFGIDVVLLRFFGGYGPNQNLTWWGGPQSVFIEKALDDEPLPIHGDGRQTRSFTYITRPRRRHRCCDRELAAEQPRRQHRCDGGDHHRRTRGAHLAARARRGLADADRDDPVRSHLEDTRTSCDGSPTSRRARELLGFEPKVDLETGLRKTISWQMERRQLSHA